MLGMNFSLTEQRVILCMLCNVYHNSCSSQMYILTKINIVRKYTWTLPKDSPHKDVAQKRRIAFGLILLSEKMEIDFEKRY